MRKIVFVILLASCGKDPKVEQAKTEVESIAASIASQTKGDEGSMGPCPGFKAKGKPFTLDPSMPKTDPWGNPYSIECGNGYEVVSAGPDGKPGTKDDVRSAGRRDPMPP